MCTFWDLNLDSDTMLKHLTTTPKVWSWSEGPILYVYILILKIKIFSPIKLVIGIIWLIVKIVLELIRILFKLFRKCSHKIGANEAKIWTSRRRWRELTSDDGLDCGEPRAEDLKGCRDVAADLEAGELWGDWADCQVGGFEGRGKSSSLRKPNPRVPSEAQKGRLAHRRRCRSHFLPAFFGLREERVN